MKKTILYVIINLEIGGSEKQLVELLKGLDRSRFEPYVCCLMGEGPLAEPLRLRGIPLSIYRFPVINYSHKIRSTCTFFSQVNVLRRLIRRLRPDIVHTVLPRACVTGGLAAWLAGVPVIVTSRRSLGIYKEGRFFLRLLENIVNIRADAVVVNSEAVKDDTVKRERIDGRKIRVIHNGVKPPPPGDPAAGWRELTGREIDGPTVCLAANFFPYKGHKDFLEAAAMVHREHPGVRFILIGDGRVRGGIERRIRELDLDGVVLLLGTRPAAEIMRLCDIVALTSYEEGFPNVILEAMAAGKPVVATSVGGVPEAVEEGKTGLLVPPGSPDELSQAILHLLTDTGEAKRMGEKAHRRAREKFGMDRMVRAYEALYQELLDNGNTPSTID